MTEKRPARLGGVIMGAALAAVGGLAVTGATHRYARAVIVDQAEQRLRLATRAGADLLAVRLDQALEMLRQLTAARGVRRDGSVAEIVDLSERVLPRALRGVVEADQSGAIRGTVPPGTEIVLPPDVVSVLVRRSAASLSVEWAQCTEGVTGLDVLLAAWPVAGSPAGGAARATVIGVLDPRELGRGLAIDAEVASAGLLVVTRAGSEVVTSPGSGQPPAPSLDALLADAGLTGDRGVLGGGESVKRRLEATWSGRREELLVMAEPVAGVPGQWAVAALLPTHMVLAAGRGLFLAFGIGAVVLIALAVALVSAWFRAENTRREALAEADRVYKLGKRSDFEGRCRFAVEQSPGAALLVRDLVVLALNQPAAELVGPAWRGMIGRRLVDVVDPGDREATESFLAVGSSRVRRLRTTLVAGGARRLAVDLTAVELGSDDGGATYLWVAVNERESLSRVESLLKEVASSDPRALALLSSDGEVTWSNPAFSQRTGVDGESLRRGNLLSLVAPADRRRARVIFASALRGKPRAALLRVRTAPRGEALVEVEARPLTLSGGTFGVLLTGQESKVVSLADASPNDHLGTVVANLGASVAHRLSNDLQALVGLLDRFKQGGDRAADCEAASFLLKRAAVELQQLMAVGRVGSSGLRLLRLGGFLERWAQRATPRVPPQVRLTVRREAGNDRILGDALQLGLVLDLTLAGAVAQLEQGGGAIEVALVEGEGTEFVRLEVSDTAEPQESLAGPEAPSGSSRSTREAALAVTRAVARRHGGRFGERSRPGIGNRIWLDLPLYRERAAPERQPVQPLRPGAILLADDEEIVRDTLATALRERGYEVVEASDGAMVVELVGAQPERFGLVVLDLLMPLMDGREAYQRLRDIAPSVPVLVCTGYEPVEDEDLRGAEAIIKPFSIEEFIRRVEEALGGTTAGRAPDGTMTS